MYVKGVTISKRDKFFRNVFYEWKTKYNLGNDVVLLDEYPDHQAVIMFFSEQSYTMWCLNPIVV